MGPVPFHPPPAHFRGCTAMLFASYSSGSKFEPAASV